MLNRLRKKPFSIHLVEDNQFYLQGIRSQMKNTFGPNISLRAFSNSQSFLESLRKKPEIVVLDYNLDEKSPIDGVSLIKEVKKVSPDSQIIVLTGENKIDTAVKCLNLGVSDYIVKEDKAIDRVTGEINDTMRGMLQAIEDKDYVKTINAIFAATLLITLMVAAFKIFFPQLLDY